MNKPIKVIAVLLVCIAVAAAMNSSIGAWSPFENPDAEPTIIVVAPTSTPSPAPLPTPTPVPTPKPLGIVKNDNLPMEVLAPTITMSFEELVGDNGERNGKDEIPPPLPPETYKLIVNEYHQFITVFKQDENGEFTIPVRYMVTTTGAYATPSPKGTFTMGDKYVRFGRFSCGVYGQYWRNVVRNIFTHSLLYTHRNANSYTASYKKLGTRGSHGCLRMLVPDARWVYYNCGPGTVVDIIRGDKNDEEAAAIKAQLVFPEKPKRRPGLKPGQIPVTEAWPGWSGNAYALYQATLQQIEEENAENQQD